MKIGKVETLGMILGAGVFFLLHRVLEVNVLLSILAGAVVWTAIIVGGKKKKEEKAKTENS